MFEDLITDRTLEDVQNRTAKGHYNATDLNRVEHAVKEISELLTKEAYPVVYYPHKRVSTVPKYDLNTLLLINGAISDKSYYKRNLTNKGAEVLEKNGSLNDTALYFDGSAKILLPLGDWLNFNKNPFTIEWRENAEDFSYINGGNPFTIVGDANNFVFHYVTGKIYLFLYNDGETGFRQVEMGDVKVGVWVHRAFVYDGSKFMFFSDGKKTWESEYNSTIPYSENYQAGIGGREDIYYPQQYYKGYMEEIRISNIARYTEDFTPPKTILDATEYVEENVEADWLLPEEYKYIKETIIKEKWIKRTSNAYIDTGIQGAGDVCVEFDGYANNVTPLFGARVASGNKTFLMIFGGTRNYMIDYNTTRYNVSADYKAGERHVFKLDKGKMYIDNVLLNTVTQSNFESGYNIFLCGMNTAGANTADTGSSCVVYNFKIYKNGELVRDFIPAKNNGVACFFDNVEQKYYDKKNTGTFEYFDITEEVTEYTPADYPTNKEMDRYLNNIKEIKRQFYQKKSTQALPKEMDRLRHTGANAIEQLIVDTYDRLNDMEKIKRKSGTFKVGELLP